MVDLQWEALRNNDWVGDDVKIELVFTPLDTKPVTPTEFFGQLIRNRLSAANVVTG